MAKTTNTTDPRTAALAAHAAAIDQRDARARDLLAAIDQAQDEIRNSPENRLAKAQHALRQLDRDFSVNEALHRLKNATPGYAEALAFFGGEFKKAQDEEVAAFEDRRPALRAYQRKCAEAIRDLESALLVDDGPARIAKLRASFGSAIGAGVVVVSA